MTAHGCDSQIGALSHLHNIYTDCITFVAGKMSMNKLRNTNTFRKRRYRNGGYKIVGFGGITKKVLNI